MNKHPLKKHAAFITVLVMFSIIPAMSYAQKKCPDGRCPKGQTCINGTCRKNNDIIICNCLVRPLPFECGQICGWVISKTLSVSSPNSNTISFQLMQAQNVSAKIYDVTGGLIKTFADDKMKEGDYEITWDAKDENGNAVSAGIYILQFDAGNRSEGLKISVIR